MNITRIRKDKEDLWYVYNRSKLADAVIVEKKEKFGNKTITFYEVASRGVRILGGIKDFKDAKKIAKGYIEDKPCKQHILKELGRI